MDISFDITLGDNIFNLKKAYTKAKPGKGAIVEANKRLYDAFVKEYTRLFDPIGENIPIIVNYGTNRSVLKTPMRTRKKT